MMKKLGDYILSLRKTHNYSQKYIYEQTGITDSLQSRIERGLNNEVSPIVLKKLAEFYNINVIDLFIVAGFIDEKDLQKFSRIFKYSELLSDTQKNHIQEEICLYTGKDKLKGDNNAL